jgi:hypothetical protein
MMTSAEEAVRQGRNRFVVDRIRHIAIHKAAVDQSDATNALAAAPDYALLVSAIEDELILTRTGAIPVPFGARVTVATAPPTASWVSRAAPKPASKAALATVQHSPLKVSSILPLSNESLKMSGVAADNEIRRALVSAAASAINTTLLSSDAAEADVSPAGLGAGLEVRTTTMGNLAEDVFNLLAGMRRPTLITSLVGALRIRNVLNGAEGLPIVIDYAAGSLVYAIDAGGLAYSLGDVEIVASSHASIALSDDPGAQPATLTSAWQTNSTFFRVDQHADWTITRPGAVRVFDLNEFNPDEGS